MALTNTDVGEYVQTNLGFTILGTNSVEWSEQLEDFIVTKVLRHYNRLIGLKKFSKIITTSATQRYVLDVLKTGQGVIDVQFPRISPGLQIDEFHILEQTFAPMTDVAGFLANRYGLEQLRHAIGSERLWEQRFEILDPTTNQESDAADAVRKAVLYISPPPRAAQTLPYTYIENVTDVKEVPLEWEQWGLDLSLAEAKIVIGGARRRFDADLQQDGAELVSEGKEEKDELLVQAAQGGLISGLNWRQF